MSYVDAVLDKPNDLVRIAERVNGQRILRDVPAPYIFYYEDPYGSHQSIFGHRCKRVAVNTSKKFYQTLREWRDAGRRIFEPDIKPVFRALAGLYQGVRGPHLNLGFFDIEAAFDADRSFAPPNDPFNAITAITLYRSADLTVLNIIWSPLMQLLPHEHRMWSVIGIYAGREDNIFWRRQGSAVAAAQAAAVSAGETVSLAADVIHSVANPIEKFTGAIHVYGGDFFATARSEWDPETLAERRWNIQEAMQIFKESNERFAAWKGRPGCA